MSFQRSLAKSRFNIDRRIRFYRKMIQFAKDGLSLDRSIQIINKRYKNSKDSLALMTGEWIALGARHGMSMSVARGWIPEAELTLITAGEASNDLATGFTEAEKLAVTSQAIKKEIFAAIGMPLFSVALLVVLLMGFRLGLGPMLLEMSALEKWPGFARTLYGLTGFIYHFWWAIAGVLVAAYFFISWSMPNLTGESRRMLDYIPPWSIYRVIQAASFMNGIAGLLKQGKDMDTALREFSKTSSPYVKRFIHAIQTKKASGMSEAEAIDVGLLDKETAGDIVDVGASNGMDQVMQSLGDDSLNKAISSVRAKSSVLKFVIIFLVGMFVFWIFSSFLLTSFNAAQEQRKAVATSH